jgi:hypothetical protein
MSADAGGRDENSITARLLRLIDVMPEEEQRLLLRELETRVINREKRRHARKPVFMMIDYRLGERLYSDFIQDLSLGGVFIETCLSIPVGRELVVTFPHKDHEGGVDVRGAVVRTSPQGIGVGFEALNPLQEQVILGFIDKF